MRYAKGHKEATRDRIVDAVNCSVQFGGGVRDLDWMGAAFAG